ncbi:hypothetical protein CYY_006520 [Polysphondylium violaceum]|uniref:Right handed beta helix domain-containing protein n=1 Tax=Polysphondylium violaceum TaxID=133409 RepID=A0A8J4PZM0_9MYCE|nr:hypothetical protein CYY_006520 [Polysphondylium violaceum]
MKSLISFTCLIFCLFIVFSQSVAADGIKGSISLIVGNQGQSVNPCGQGGQVPVCASMADAYQTYLTMTQGLNYTSSLQFELMDGTYGSNFSPSWMKSLSIIPFSRTKGSVVFTGAYINNFVANNYTLSFTNITFSNAYGIIGATGAIDVEFDSCTFGNVNIDLTNPLLSLNGTGCSTPPQLVLNNCLFNNLTMGADLIDVTSYTVTITNTVVSNVCGGFYFTNSSTTISGSQFTQANSYSFATLLFEGGSATVKDSVFSENIVSSIGIFEAINSPLPSGPFLLDHISVNENTIQTIIPPVYIFNVQSSVVILGSVFTNNSFENHNSAGGAIQITLAPNIAIQYCTFTNNSALLNGGSLSISKSTVSVSFSLIDQSSSSVGGAIYVDDNSVVNIKNTSIIDNYSKNSGQNVYCKNSNISVYNSSINSYNHYGFSCQSGCSVDSDMGNICEHNSGLSKKVIIGLVVGLGGSIAVLFIVLLILRRQRNKRHYQRINDGDHHHHHHSNTSTY